jgi:hypothetical protein
MINTEMLNKKLGQAIALASTLFKDKVDKAGKPYILHCLRVMNNVGNDPILQIIAVLHDIAEDIVEYPLSRLFIELDLPWEIAFPLQLLTHEEGTDYEQYIKSISGNKAATIVKLADLKDNSDITRLKGLRKKDFDRLEKYHKAFVYLSN